MVRGALPTIERLLSWLRRAERLGASTPGIDRLLASGARPLQALVTFAPYRCRADTLRRFRTALGLLEVQRLKA